MDSKENSSEAEDSDPGSVVAESWNKVSFVDAKKRHRFVIEDFRNWSRWVAASGRSVVLKGPVFTLAGLIFLSYLLPSRAGTGLSRSSKARAQIFQKLASLFLQHDKVRSFNAPICLEPLFYRPVKDSSVRLYEP